MDQYNFGRLDQDPHQIEEQNPDLHRSEKVEVLDDHFGALKGPNLEEKNPDLDPDPHQIER